RPRRSIRTPPSCLLGGEGPLGSEEALGDDEPSRATAAGPPDVVAVAARSTWLLPTGRLFAKRQSPTRGLRPAHISAQGELRWRVLSAREEQRHLLPLPSFAARN